jgi:UDP-N-acetylglucosamine enolpyruvyl transferase
MGKSLVELLKMAEVIVKANSSKECLSKLIIDLKIYLSNNPNEKDVKKIIKLITEIEKRLREKEIKNNNTQSYDSSKNEQSKSRRR